MIRKKKLFYFFHAHNSFQITASTFIIEVFIKKIQDLDVSKAASESRAEKKNYV
jgi:hypothetical protein